VQDELVLRKPDLVNEPLAMLVVLIGLLSPVVLCAELVTPNVFKVQFQMRVVKSAEKAQLDLSLSEVFPVS
jgi:hypothetical protein